MFYCEVSIYENSYRMIISIVVMFLVCSIIHLSSTLIYEIFTFKVYRYKAIVKYKTAFYSFYLPVALAINMVSPKVWLHDEYLLLAIYVLLSIIILYYVNGFISKIKVVKTTENRSISIWVIIWPNVQCTILYIVVIILCYIHVHVLYTIYTVY